MDPIGFDSNIVNRGTRIALNFMVTVIMTSSLMHALRRTLAIMHGWQINYVLDR